MDSGISGQTRPVVQFSGLLEDRPCIDLIDRIRSMRNDLFFDEILLRISSPGGQLSALRYFAEAVRELQHGGLTLATHAVTTVGSAAAVMLSLGDVRTAHRKAVLLYHTGRLPGVDGALTAKGATSIATALSSADDEIIDLLVARAARSPAPAADTPEDQFDLGDWQVIGRLSPGNAKLPKTTLKRFRRRVADAFEDPSTRLRSLYADFCVLDAPISPHLAMELGLIDGIGDGNPVTRKPRAATDEGGLSVPEWSSLYPGGRVPRYALTRHTLILGESGSGKTVSGVLPVLAAILREGSPVSCALVIDPKWDLFPIMRRVAGANCEVRLLRAGEDSINIMSGSRSVAAEVSAGQWLEAARKILARAATFADSPAKIFAGRSASSARNAFWENEGSRLAQCVLAFTLLMSRPDRVDGLLAQKNELGWKTRRLLRDFGTFAGLRGDDASVPSMNIVAIAHRALSDFFVAPEISSLGARRLPARDVIDAIQKGGTAGGGVDALAKELRYWDKARTAENQYAGAVGEGRRCLVAFADPAPARSLFFGVERMSATVDFAPDAQADTASNGRRVYVYQPDLGDEDALVAKALKGAFFEAVLASPARRDRGATMPMTFYVSDEFHRFITSDASHGEQNFLDRCRSYGAACVLATQSDASVRHSLVLAGEPSPDTAIRLLLTNTATKLTFRSTEGGVRDLLDGICPGEGPHRVTAIRPPAGLRPGECYASLPDGRFERRQLQPFEPPARAPGRAASR